MQEAGERHADRGIAFDACMRLLARGGGDEEIDSRGMTVCSGGMLYVVM